MGNLPQQQQPQEKKQAPPASTTTTTTTATTTPNADAEKQAALIRALTALTTEWKTVLGSLASDVVDPAGTFEVAKFKKEAYALLARRDGSGHAGLPGAKMLLSATDSRKPIYKELELVEADVKADGLKREAIHEQLDDLVKGGDVQYASDRVIASYLTTSTAGREWWKSTDAQAWVGPFAEYISNTPKLSVHVMHEAGPFLAAAQGKKRGTALLPLLNLLTKGDVTGKGADAAKQTKDAIPAPTDEQKKKWDEEAKALKAELEPYLPPDGAVGKDAHGTKKLDAHHKHELIGKISGAAIEVRDRLFADPVFMRRVAMLGEQSGPNPQGGAEMQTLFRSLDPVEALYDKVHGRTLQKNGTIAQPLDRNQSAATILTPQQKFELIRNFMASHPGKEGQPIRMRVATHQGMMMGLDDNQQRDLWKLAARGTLDSALEDRLYAAIKANSAEQVARVLLAMSGEDRESMKALQSDVVLRNAMASEELRKQVTVDGVTMRPYDMILLLWGQRPGSTKDEGQTGATEDHPDGEVKPLNFEERRKLDTELYAPTIAVLKDELSAADSWFFSGARTSDSAIVNALNSFQNKSASKDYVDLIRRAGVPPGQELATRFNAQTGQSIQGLLKGGCGDDARRAGERVLAITIDSASVGTVGGGIGRAGDKPDAAPMKLTQALQEVKTDGGNGDTVSIVVHKAAEKLRDELHEGLAWNGADYDDVQSIWTNLKTKVDPSLAEIEKLTKRKVWTVELLQNAYQEIDGPLLAAFDKRLGDDDRKNAKAMMGLTSADISARQQAAAGPVDQKEAAKKQAEDVFGVKAKELFEACSALSSLSQKGAFEAAKQKRDEFVKLTLGAAPAANAPKTDPRVSKEQAVDVAPGAGVVAAQHPEDFYRVVYGITPQNHAVQIARSFRRLENDVNYQRPDGVTNVKPEEVADWLGVDRSLVAGASVIAPPDNEKPVVDERNRQLVRPGFTAATAESNAREMWRLLHEGGEVHLIQTTLYGMYNDEEQRLIRLAFRQLSGGIDWQFYIQQAKYLAKHREVTSGTSQGDRAQMLVGGEGTDAGQQITKKTVVNVTANEGELDALNAIAQHGELDIRDELRSAISHDNRNQIYRIVDRADDQQCRKILADTALVAKLQDNLPSYGWDRVYRVLTGQDDLATRLESRAHGDDGFIESLFGGTDETGMNEDVKEYVHRMRVKFEEEEIKKARVNKDAAPDQQLIAIIVARRVREACKKLASHPEVNRIIEEELSKTELSKTQGLIINEGQESNVSAVAGGGKGDEVIEEIKRMPKAERDKRLNDPEYMMRLSRQLKPEELQQAITLLQSTTPDKAPSEGEEQQGGEKKDNQENLAEIAKLVTPQGHRDADVILQKLTELSPEEHERLINNPTLVAQVMSVFQYAPPKKREIAQRVLGYRKEKAEDTLGKGIVWPDATQAACEGRTIDDKERQRLAYLQENAVVRIQQGAQVSWNILLAQLVEVYKMDFFPKGLHDVAAPQQPAQLAQPGEAPKQDPNKDLANKLEQDLRRGIFERVSDDAKKRADDDDKMKTVKMAIMRQGDPSAIRIREQWGTFRDDSAGVEDTLRKASDQQLIDTWTSIKMTKPNGTDSLLDVYERYRAAYDNAGGEKAVSSPEQDKLQKTKLDFMNYVVDISGWFESDLLGHAGGLWDDSDPTKKGEERSKVKQRDNEEYNKWRKIIRDRIPTLPKDKIAAAINATDRPADVALITNPNRTFQAGREFREDEYLRRFGTVGAGARVANAERASVNDTLSRYGREAVTAETNVEGGYGVITKEEGEKVEKTGAEVDKAMAEFSAARAKIASIAGMIVGLIAGAAVTILTGGAGAGLAWMLVAGAISGAAGAAGTALAQKAIQGSEFDMNQEGIAMIAEGAISGMVFAGTTKMAQGIMKGLAGPASLKAQAQAMEALIANKPTVWQQLLTGAKGVGYAATEGVVNEGLNIAIEAGLAPIDPSNWVHGWDEGVIRARGKVRDKLQNADQRLLGAGIVSALTHVGISAAHGDKKNAPPPPTPPQKLEIKSKLQKHFERIKTNAGKYLEVSDITIQAFASFAGNKLTAGLLGKPIDWGNIPEDVFNEFVSQWQGLAPGIHADHHKLAVERKHAIDSQIKEHGHLLKGGELAHYQSLNPDIAVGDIITIEQYLTARRGMFEARAAMWESAIKRELTPNERAAFQEWCRQAKDSAEYQARLDTNPLEVQAVKDAAKKFTTDVADPSGAESIKTKGGGDKKPEQKPEKKDDKKPDDKKPAVDVKPDKPESPKTADEMAKITGNVDPIADSTFQGKARSEAEPEKIAAEIQRAMPLVAGHFPGAVEAVGGNILKVTVGDASFLVNVVTMSAESGEIARYRFTGPETAIIEISDRARDKHVERAVADLIAEMRAVRESQLKGKPLPKESAFKPGATGKELSADDLGKVAQIKALLRQLRQAENPGEGMKPNPVVLEQLNRDIDVLLGSMGLSGPEGQKRLHELVDPHLTGAERSQLQIRNDAARRKEAEAKLDAHGGSELHNHFLGIVDPKAFADQTLAQQQAIEDAKNEAAGKQKVKITKSSWEVTLDQIAAMDHLAHKNVEDAPGPDGKHKAKTVDKRGDKFDRRGTSGDAVAIAKQVKDAIAGVAPTGKVPEWVQQGHADISALEAKLKAAQNESDAATVAKLEAELSKKKAELAEKAVRVALTATEETDFNSAYEIRDELIKGQLGGPDAHQKRVELERLKAAKPPDPAAIKKLQNEIENLAYDDIARQTVRELIRDGQLYSEQSNSLKKLNERFTKPVMDKVIWEVTAEMVKNKEITEAQALQLRQLTMVLTGFFGDEETRKDEIEAEKDPEKKKLLKEKFNQAAWDKAKGDLRDQLGIDEKGELKKGKDGFEGRSDIMGIDIAGPETAAFNAQGKERFKDLYRLLKEAAAARGRPMVLRPHVGEGFTDSEAGSDFHKNESKQKGDEAAHYDRARKNLDAMLQAIKDLGPELDTSKVIIRFGHATHATPEQAILMAQLGIVAEVNLHSNIQTGSLNQLDKSTGKSFEQENYQDHALLTYILIGATTILSTDAHSVMDTTLAKEYERAKQIIEEFLQGRAKVRVTKEIAAGRGEQVVVNKGTPYERIDYFLTKDQLNKDELGMFTTGYERLHKYATDYRQGVAAGDKSDKLLWNDLFQLLDKAEKTDGEKLHERNLLQRLLLTNGAVDEGALKLGESIDKAKADKAAKHARDLLTEPEGNLGVERWQTHGLNDTPATKDWMKDPEFVQWYQKWIQQPDRIYQGEDGTWKAKHVPGTPDKYRAMIDGIAAKGNVSMMHQATQTATDLSHQFPDLAAMDPKSKEYQDKRVELIKQFGEEAVVKYETFVLGAKGDGNKDRAVLDARVGQIIDDAQLAMLKSKFPGCEVFITGSITQPSKEFKKIQDLDLMVIAPEDMPYQERVRLENQLHGLKVKTTELFQQETKRGELEVDAKVLTPREAFGVFSQKTPAGRTPMGFHRIDVGNN